MGSTQCPVAGSLLTLTGSRFDTIMRLCRGGAPIGGISGAAAAGTEPCGSARPLPWLRGGCDPEERLASIDELR